MPRKSDLKTINNRKLDKRVKLSNAQRQEIKELTGMATQTSVADLYGVSRRTIQFIWYPEQLKENKARRAERGGTKQYYDREKNTIAMKKHRDYKKKLYKEGLI